VCAEHILLKAQKTRTRLMTEFWIAVLIVSLLLTGASLTVIVFFASSFKLQVYFNESDSDDERLKSAVTAMKKLNFVAPMWAKNGHVSTFYCSVIRGSEPIQYARHYFKLKCGGRVSIDVVAQLDSPDAPVAFIVPGIAGSSSAHYVRNAVSAMNRRGFHAVVKRSKIFD
jgi:hypothetical protein